MSEVPRGDPVDRIRLPFSCDALLDTSYGSLYLSDAIALGSAIITKCLPMPSRDGHFFGVEKLFARKREDA